MISAGEVRSVTDQQVVALVKKIQEGVKPDKARQELGLQWGEFNECIRLAALELRRMTPEGRFIASAMWQNYIPVDMREGTYVLTKEEKAEEFFKGRSAARARYEIPGHPDIKYVSGSRLTDEEKARLEAGTLGDESPLYAYSPYVGHDNLRVGETYYFAREDAEKLDLFDPQKLANRLFESKRAEVTVLGAETAEAGWLRVNGADVNHNEAQILRRGGYALVVFEGEEYWMSNEGADRSGAMRVLTAAEKALKTFEKAEKTKVEGHPEVEYVSDDSLTEREKNSLSLLVMSGGADEGASFVPYTSSVDFMGLKKGKTYWFTAEGAVKLGLTDPAQEAGRIFASKRRFGHINGMMISSADVTYSEARTLSEGGYAAVRLDHNVTYVGGGDRVHNVPKGGVVWMAAGEAGGLVNVTAAELARRESGESDVKQTVNVKAQR